MGSAFHQLCPRYSGTLTPTAPTAIRLWETFTFTLNLYIIIGYMEQTGKNVIILIKNYFYKFSKKKCKELEFHEKKNNNKH